MKEMLTSTVDFNERRGMGTMSTDNTPADYLCLLGEVFFIGEMTMKEL